MTTTNSNSTTGAGRHRADGPALDKDGTVIATTKTDASSSSPSTAALRPGLLRQRSSKGQLPSPTSGRPRTGRHQGRRLRAHRPERGQPHEEERQLRLRAPTTSSRAPSTATATAPALDTDEALRGVTVSLVDADSVSSPPPRQLRTAPTRFSSCPPAATPSRSSRTVPSPARPDRGHRLHQRTPPPPASSHW